MRANRRRLLNFESCSVALFASLVLGGATVPPRAQAAAPSTRSMTNTARAPGTPSLRASPRIAAPDPLPAQPAAAPEPDGSISSPGFDESLK